jgi:hypothetical protein
LAASMSTGAHTSCARMWRRLARNQVP